MICCISSHKEGAFWLWRTRDPFPSAIIRHSVIYPVQCWSDKCRLLGLTDRLHFCAALASSFLLQHAFSHELVIISETLHWSSPISLLIQMIYFHFRIFFSFFFFHTTWIYLITVGSHKHSSSASSFALSVKAGIIQMRFVRLRESKCFLCSLKVKPGPLSACQFALLPEFTYSLRITHGLLAVFV